MSTEEAPKEALKEATWESFGLDPRLLEAIKKAGFTKPTPVQAQSIGPGMDGRDLIVSAQTGTGKTAAFSLPLLDYLKDRAGTYGLVLAPTREIALQTKAVIDIFGPPVGLTAAALIGGINIKLDMEALKARPQILVATPGRLCDHLERGNVWLEYLEIVVLDEADRMLDMGFADQLNTILDETPESKQTMLFSATMPPNVDKLARKYLYDPIKISIGRTVNPALTVEQKFVFTNDERKLDELMKILDNEQGSVIIFTRSKLGAAKLYRALKRNRFNSLTQIHSNLEQADREYALEDFKSGKYRMLIATDVVGRGIHVDGVAHVVNFDFPRDPSDYVHRIGRTGRAGLKGKATTLVTGRDRRELAELERLLGHKVAGNPGSGSGGGGGGGRGPRR